MEEGIPDPRAKASKGLSLMEDGKGGVAVKGLEEVMVHTSAEIFSHLSRGSARRRTAETLCNKQVRPGARSRPPPPPSSSYSTSSSSCSSSSSSSSYSSSSSSRPAASTTSASVWAPTCHYPCHDASRCSH